MILSKDFFEEFELDLTGTCNLQCPLCSRNYKHAQHMNKKNINSKKYQTHLPKSFERRI